MCVQMRCPQLSVARIENVPGPVMWVEEERSEVVQISSVLRRECVWPKCSGSAGRGAEYCKVLHVALRVA